MNKHTPGPWNIHKCEPNGNFSVYASGPLAYIEKESDARLIASAPDLLQAVEDFLLLATLHDWEGAAIDNAREALRKAKGEA